MTARQFTLKLPKRAKPGQRLRLKWPKLAANEWSKVPALARARLWWLMDANSRGLTFAYLPAVQSDYYR